MEFGAAHDALAYLDELPAEDQFQGLWPEVLPGHYDYLAPEQALEPEEADPRSDIYSAGCVLYHCLTGQPPFATAKPLKMALLHAMRWPERPADLVPDLPAQVEETLWSLLAKDPAQRFQKAGDVAYALDQYSDHETEAEDVHVVDVSSEYLDWVRSTHPQETGGIPEESVGVTPELTNFLHWLDARQARRRARRAKQG
jgi:serine/threonine-protein kinase